MLVFIAVAIGLLLWIAFLLAVMVLSGAAWTLSRLGLWMVELLAGPDQQKVASVRGTPPQVQRRVAHPTPPRSAPPVRDREPHPAQAPASSEIWPKWTPAHRRYVDEELTLWQEQFDALISHR
ncbi:hypothetical protein [Pseudarthrobacter sulfonivorans]|uniref:hypothetical protein n=1 Tax=Pseudarthrobacter sulfonivorans TaxID=121292 RepID=UPI002858056C|nr:hypothetical protein [Pseudarthrobacter sulfonivorans]MDR6415535.1 hypothetical protein [Pseudarthrobacter sulfonivorans]